MILVDTNVLFDVVTDNSAWADWSIAQLEAAELRGPIAINDVVFAEFSVRYPSVTATEEAVDRLGLTMLATPPHRAVRRRQGVPAISSSKRCCQDRGAA